MSRQVLVPKFDFLPWSERFILDELCGLRRYEAVLWTRQLLHRSERLVRAPARLLDERWPRPALLGDRLASLVAELPAALVYFEFGTDCMALVGRLERRLPVPIVAALRGFDVAAITQRMPGALSSLARRIDLFLVRSQAMAARVMEMGVPARRVRVHHTGIPIRQFRPVPRQPAAPPTFLCCSRYVDKKGIDDAIRAADLLRRRGAPPFRLRIHGEGPLGPSYRALVASLDLGDVVEVGPRISRAAVRTALAEAVALIQASRTAADGSTEGIPVVLIEAIAAGLPVVATRHAGIPELVRDGEAGFLVPERDAAALATAMGRILDGAPLDVAAARRQVAVSFDSVRQNAVLEQIFDELIAGRRLPSPADGI